MKLLNEICELEQEAREEQEKKGKERERDNLLGIKLRESSLKRLERHDKEEEGDKEVTKKTNKYTFIADLIESRKDQAQKDWEFKQKQLDLEKERIEIEAKKSDAITALINQQSIVMTNLLEMLKKK